MIRKIKTYYATARGRASYRQSRWNLALVPVAFLAWGLCAYLLFQGMWAVHLVFYPAHSDHLSDFWAKGIGFLPFLSSFFLLIPLLLISIPIAMLVANILFYLLPHARRVFDQEAAGIQGASFAESVGDLLRVLKGGIPVAFLISLLGAATLAQLR